MTIFDTRGFTVPLLREDMTGLAFGSKGVLSRRVVEMTADVS